MNTILTTTVALLSISVNPQPSPMTATFRIEVPAPMLTHVLRQHTPQKVELQPSAIPNDLLGKLSLGTFRDGEVSVSVDDLRTVEVVADSRGLALRGTLRGTVQAYASVTKPDMCDKTVSVLGREVKTKVPCTRREREKFLDTHLDLSYRVGLTVAPVSLPAPASELRVAIRATCDEFAVGGMPPWLEKPVGERLCAELQQRIPESLAVRDWVGNPPTLARAELHALTVEAANDAVNVTIRVAPSPEVTSPSS